MSRFSYKPDPNFKLVLRSSWLERPDTRFLDDQRRRCDMWLASLTGDDGHEYRKVFYVSRGVRPHIPQSGTHADYARYRDQLNISTP